VPDELTDRLDDPDEPEEVVAALEELGIDADDARAAVAEGRVPLVLASQVFDEPERYSLADLEEASGLPAEVLREALHDGLGNGRRYTQSDLDAAHLFAQLVEVLPLDALLRLSRSRSIQLSAVARADMALIRDQIVRPLREAGADDLAIAMALAEHAAEFDRISRRLLVHDYRRHVREILRSELSTLATQSQSPSIEASVGFVDLVGYTALAARVDPHGLDDLLDTFERRVVEAVGDDDQVQLVKFLGDAAMFVSTDLRALVDVLLVLTTEARSGDDEEMPLRGGIARGEVLLREGDYYGTPVNVAARLTDIARPWSLLADDELRDALEDHYDVRRIRPTRVRGVGSKRPLVVRAMFDLEPVED
jgi:adenylate cyclase